MGNNGLNHPSTPENLPLPPSTTLGFDQIWPVCIMTIEERSAICRSSHCKLYVSRTYLGIREGVMEQRSPICRSGHCKLHVSRTYLGIREGVMEQRSAICRSGHCKLHVSRTHRGTCMGTFDRKHPHAVCHNDGIFHFQPTKSTSEQDVSFLSRCTLTWGPTQAKSVCSFTPSLSSLKPASARVSPGQVSQSCNLFLLRIPKELSSLKHPLLNIHIYFMIVTKE